MIQGALAAIGITGDLSTREAQLDRSQQLAEAMGETIGLLPGGALLNSLGGGGSEDGKSQERIIHDIERDLRERGEDENILLVFDDVEQADQSSLAVLQGLLQRLSGRIGRVTKHFRSSFVLSCPTKMKRCSIMPRDGMIGLQSWINY